jgi:hypothetical protein
MMDRTLEGFFFGGCVAKVLGGARQCSLRLDSKNFRSNGIEANT